MSAPAVVPSGGAAVDVQLEAPLHRALQSFFPSRHVVAFKLKAVALLSIAIVFIYLEAESSATSNWDDARSVGFTEFQRCEGPGSSYMVSDASVSAGGALLTIPLVYGTSPQPQVCFTEAALTACFKVVFSLNPYATLNAANVKGLFDAASGRSYFPLSVWIILLSCLSLFITQIYEQKTRLFVPRVVSEALSDRAVSIVMTRANYILCIAIVGLLLGSAQNFTTLFKEDCNSIFHGGGVDGIRDAKSFCNGISGCNAQVASVVNPHTFFFNNYRALLIFLALMLLLSTLIQCFSFLVCGRDPDDDVFVINRAAYDNSFRQGPTILTQLRGRRASEEKRMAVARAERMSAAWTIVSTAQLMSLRPDAGEYDGECPICLTSLCPERLNLLLRKKPMRAVRQILSRSFGTPRAGSTPIGSMRSANANGTGNGNADNTSGRMSGRIVGAIAAVRAKPIFNGAGVGAGPGAGSMAAAIAIAPGALESNAIRRQSGSSKSNDSGKYTRVNPVVDDEAPVGSARFSLTSHIANLSARLTDLSGYVSPGSSGAGAGAGTGAGGGGGSVASVGDGSKPLEPIHEAAPKLRLGQHPLFSERSVDSDGYCYADHDDDAPSGLLSGHVRSSPPAAVGEGWVDELIRRLSVTVETMVGDMEESRRGSGNRPVEGAADGDARDASPLVGGVDGTIRNRADNAAVVGGGSGGSEAESDVMVVQVTSLAPMTGPDGHIGVAVDSGRGVPAQPDVEAAGNLYGIPDASDRREQMRIAAGAEEAPAAGGGGSEPTDTTVVVKVPCHHVFHRSCLMEWALTSCLCPLCRAPLAPGVRMGRPDDEEI